MDDFECVLEKKNGKKKVNFAGAQFFGGGSGVTTTTILTNLLTFLLTFLFRHSDLKWYDTNTT